MAKTLNLATGLQLPADEAVTQKYGFIGRSGSGKSYAAMRLAELFLESGAQIIALDWVGIWWSLRLAADGKTPGFEHVYIFGGEHADVDLKPESGALMADLVVDKHISVVLDVMHFRKAERTRFATAFAEQFFHRKKTARTACHLFIEEAQAYLPQFVRGEEARMVGVFEDIGKVGRNYGIGNSLISQRPQAINKDVLNQVEVLLAFQTNGPQERKAIAGWTAENTTAGAAMIQQLPTLRVGEPLVWSPQWLRMAEKVAITKRVTYDASSTPTLKAKAIAPKRLAPADLEQLGVEIAATIEKAKADDPKELHKQLAAARAELAKLHKQAPIVHKGDSKTVEVLTDADRTALAKLTETLNARRAAMIVTQDQIRQLLRAEVDEAVEGAGQRVQVMLLTHQAKFVADLDAKGFGKLIEKLERVSAPPQHNQPQKSVAALWPRPSATGHTQSTTPAGRTVTPSVGGAALPPGERAVLTASAQWTDGVTRDQLGVLTGYKRSSRDAYIARMLAKGLIVIDAGRVLATPEGMDALGPGFDRLPTGDALYRWWQGRLPDGERKVLDVLMSHGQQPVQREAIDQATGYMRSSRDAYLSRLSARRLVESVGRGEVRASAELFS